MTRMDKITVTVLVLVVLAYIVVGGYFDFRFYHPGPLSPEARALYEDLVAADEAGEFDLQREEACDDPWCY